MKLIQINPSDNVAVALTDISSGETISLDNITITAIENIARGHKIALYDINDGSDITK